MNLGSVTYTSTFVRVYNSLHKFVKDIFGDERIKSYKINKVFQDQFDEKNIAIHVRYTSQSVSTEMVILTSPEELLNSHLRDSQVKIYKDLLKY